MAFEPIIGSGFGDIAAQRQFYNRQNLGVDEGNIQRLGQAQDTQNNWLLRVRQLQDQDAARQASAASGAQDRQDAFAQAQIARMDRARQEAEHTREFDTGTELEKQRLKAAQDERQKQLDILDRTGEALAPDLQAKAGPVNDAQEAYAEALSKLNTEATKLHAELPDADKPQVQLDRAGARFVPSASNALKKLPDSAIAANEKLSEARDEFFQAQTKHKIAQDDFKEFHDQVLKSGLNVVTRDGEYMVFNPITGKYFGKKTKGTSTESAQKAIEGMGEIGDVRKMFPWLAGLELPTAPDSSSDATAPAVSTAAPTKRLRWDSSLMRAVPIQ